MSMDFQWRSSRGGRRSATIGSCTVWLRGCDERYGIRRGTNVGSWVASITIVILMAGALSSTASVGLENEAPSMVSAQWTMSATGVVSKLNFDLPMCAISLVQDLQSGA